MKDGILSRELSTLSTLALAAMNDAVVIAEADGSIVAWNPAAERLFGYTPDEIRGQNITQLCDADRQWESRDIINRVSSGEVYTNPTTIRRSKSGESLYVSLAWSPLQDDSGANAAMVGVFRDIRAARRIDLALKQRRASDIEEGLVAALLDVSSDLGRAASSSNDPAIAAAHDKVGALIAELRADAQQLERFPATGDAGIADVIRKLCHELVPPTTATKLNLHDIPRPGAASAETLIYVANEALANAVRHSAATRIGIDLRQAGDSYALTIQDDGGGFDSERVQGGLGLQRMRLRASRVGGELSVFSIPGMGTTVSVFVPA